MPLPGLAIGLLSQLPSIFGGLFGGGKQKRLARKIKLMDPTYKVSEYAKDQLSTAQNAYNGRMAGATNAEQNILTNQSNQFANIDRNASDSSQALALAAGIGGQTNESLNQLGVAEGENKQGMLSNLNAAMQNMTQEERLVYEDKLRKYQEALAAKEGLNRSGMVNQQNAFNQVGNIGALFASGLFGNNNSTSGSSGGGSGNSVWTGPTPQQGAAGGGYGRRTMPRLRFG